MFLQRRFDSVTRKNRESRRFRRIQFRKLSLREDFLFCVWLLHAPLHSNTHGRKRVCVWRESVQLLCLCLLKKMRRREKEKERERCLQNEVGRSSAHKHPRNWSRVFEATVGSVIRITCERIPVCVCARVRVFVMLFLIPFVVEWRVNKRMSAADGAEAFQWRIMNLAESSAAD